MSLGGPALGVSFSPPVARRLGSVLLASVSPPFPAQLTLSLTPRSDPCHRPASTRVFQVFPGRSPVFEPTRTLRCVERFLLPECKPTQGVCQKNLRQCGPLINTRHTYLF